MAAATLMPLLAQSFVDQASQTTFDIVRSSRSARVAPSTPSPSRPARSPKRVTPSPRSRRLGIKDSPRDQDGRPVEDIKSWSDQTLAERYQFVEEVGYGNWGSVWQVRPKLDGPDVPPQSVKLVHRSRNPTSSARVRALWTEFKCIRALRNSPHPNLITFHSFIVTPSYGLVVMDFHPQLMPVALPESRAKNYFRQLLSAVEHLHAHGITHNDIKPSNILLSHKDLALGRPILIDFGFSQQYSLSAPDRFLSSLSWGTPEYLSPERAKGLVHDERLSDIFALGVTMYEVVVGRTPFEKSEDETFLNREQLEVYYHRTTTGKFYGDYLISTELEALVHLMTDPSVHLRIQSCATALRHRFFDQSGSSSSGRRAPGTPSSYSTPSRSKTAIHTPSSTVASVKQKSVHASPRQTPKNAAPFAIFQDPEAAPSPAPSSRSTSSFAPRPLALANRASTNLSPAPETPVLKKAVTPPVPASTVATEPRPTIKSPPAPSRIPVRRADVASPVAPASVKRFVSNPLTSPIRPAPGVRPRVVSQPLLSFVKQPLGAEVASTSGVGAGPARSGSLKTVKRKPAPTFSELDCVPSSSSKSSRTFVDEEAEEEQEDELERSIVEPVVVAEEPASAPTSPVLHNEDDTTFTTRSYTIEIGKTDGRSSPFSKSELPRLGKSSRALSSTLRKLSVKHVHKASSSMSFATLKQSLGGRPRSSTGESTFEIIEAGRVEERNAVTLPLNFKTKPLAASPPPRLRLNSFARRVQDVLDARKTVDPFQISPSSPFSTPVSHRQPAVGKSPQPLQPTIPAPFSFNNTTPLPSSTSTEASQSSTSSTPIRISPPQRKSSLRIRAKSPADSVSSLASPISSPNYSQDDFKPGHRRIPTAIRNLPSVVLHESADDADFSESDYSRADTPALDRVASPPPPPRVVEPSRQLPTWVPEDVSSDEGSDADVDEPTIKLVAGSPSRIKRKPSRTASMRTPTKGTPSERHGAAVSTASGVSPSRPPFGRKGTYESVSPVAAVAKGSVTASTRPPSPSHSVLPFTNLQHLRSDSQSTVGTVDSSHSHLRSASRTATRDGPTGGVKPKGLHKRSRPVLSFFSISLGGGSGSGEVNDGSMTRPSSRASNLSSLAWSTTSRAQLDEGGAHEQMATSGRKMGRKGGRLRRVMSKVFG
ncbi:hypothetical protein JCM8208_005599 [Rhodotorula glutinis]